MLEHLILQTVTATAKPRTATQRILRAGTIAGCQWTHTNFVSTSQSRTSRNYHEVCCLKRCMCSGIVQMQHHTVLRIQLGATIRRRRLYESVGARSQQMERTNYKYEEASRGDLRIT